MWPSLNPISINIQWKFQFFPIFFLTVQGDQYVIWSVRTVWLQTVFIWRYLFPANQHHFKKRCLYTLFLFLKMSMYLVLVLEDVYVPCSWYGRCLCNLFLILKMSIYLVLVLEDAFVPCSWSGRCLCALFLIWKMSMYLVLDLKDAYIYLVLDLEDVYVPCPWS